MAPKLSAPLWAGRELVDRIARRSPARLALMTFAGVIAVFTALLNLPAATSTGVRAPFVDAFFTATSAVCVTGLVTVPTFITRLLTGIGLFFVAAAAGTLGIALGTAGAIWWAISANGDRARSAAPSAPALRQ